MQNFIVLGYIPGTQVQITFVGWLFIAGFFVALCMSPPPLPKIETINMLTHGLATHLKQWMSEPVVQ